MKNSAVYQLVKQSIRFLQGNGHADIYHQRNLLRIF